MKPRRIRFRLKLAVACFAYIAVAVLQAQPAPQSAPESRRVEIDAEYGTPCPRPCWFPQLEEATDGSR